MITEDDTMWHYLVCAEMVGTVQGLFDIHVRGWNDTSSPYLQQAVPRRLSFSHQIVT